jgi:tetratricopeptide (TPR) repeat protein
MSDIKPVIFISYSHKDEPEKPAPDEVAWLTFVQSFLAPVVKVGIFDIWVDEHLHGGDVLDPEIKKKLAACDIFVLLASRFSLASTYVVETEIATIRQRQKDGEDVHMFPVLLSPVPNAALKQLKDLVLRPRDAKPFSTMSRSDRESAMSAIADEIATLAEGIAKRKNGASTAVAREAMSTAGLEAVADRNGRIAEQLVDVSHLPETAYERLVGRELELERLDDAWTNRKTNIISLIAEGGAGKSALVNEWLKKLRVDHYGGAAAVLGWSFYSQGTKERATSAEQFLNWAIGKLGIKVETTGATAKGEAIAEAMLKSRVLLVLDGCEPLQHGVDKRQGELKDHGLRALLRRFAAMPANGAHGLLVLTSRVRVADLSRWKDDSAPVVDVDKLSEAAGAALLRDNGVWGTDKELHAAAHDFGGHPLALGLLASFLKDTQMGDVRRRDHVRGFFADVENPRHDHAKRVMESYEKEWLAGQPALLAIMHIVGLFDRPANFDCLHALRKKPVIMGLTDIVANLGEDEWRRAIGRLREARLLAPTDASAPEALDAHPLVREWFGARLERTNINAWLAGHSRLYDHLRRTKEGDEPSLEQIAPLYQAIAHGCRAGRYQEALDKIYIDRICRRKIDGRIQFYARDKLGAFGSDLAAIAWFFDKPYESPVTKLKAVDQSWVLGDAASCLRTQGRFDEALPATRAALKTLEHEKNWRGAATYASNLSLTELLTGDIANAVIGAAHSVVLANRSGDELNILYQCVTYASALHAAGRWEEAERLFVRSEQLLKKLEPRILYLYSLQGYRYCEWLLEKGELMAVCDRADASILISRRNNWLLDIALDTLALGRARLGLLLLNVSQRRPPGITCNECFATRASLNEAVNGLRAADNLSHVPGGFLARSTFHRSVGDWNGATFDLNEVEEVAKPGPMRLFLCDMAFERARLAFAKIEAFAPLNGLIDDSRPKPVALDAAEAKSLKEEAAAQLAIAADYIKTCGYHRRDEELAELQAVLRGERKFADLPPRV